MEKSKLTSCTLCGRREFLQKLAVLSGATILPGELLAAIPGPVPASAQKQKKDAVKVKVVFSYHLADVQNTPDWPNIGFDFRPVMKNMVDTLNADVEGVEFIPAKANTAEDGKKIVAADDITGEISGYMVVQLNCWNPAVNGIVESGKPVIHVPMPYGGDGGWLYNVSSYLDLPNYEVMTAFNFQDVVGISSAFALLKDGTVDDFKKAASSWRKEHTPKVCKSTPRPDTLKCLTPDKTLAKLSGMKILSMERDDPNMFGHIKETFGIEVESVKYGELNSLAEKMDTAKARAIADKWRFEAQSVEDVTEDVLLGCAKLYLGMKQMLADHKAQALTINCLGGCYSGQLSSYPCLGFMQLQDEDLFGICEDDIESTVTMMVFHAMTGRMGYLSDPALDITRRRIIYAHCVCTRKFLGKGSEQRPYEILTHSEDRQGASVRTIAPVGYPVTTLKFNIPERQLSIHTGVITGNDRDDRACRTKIVAEVTGDYEKMYSAWGYGRGRFSWHRLTFLGDFRKEAVNLAEKIGYEVIFES